jgi:hypothetical protein
MANIEPAEDIKSVIKKFNTEKSELLNRVRHIDEFIESYRKICTHDMVDDGHDSHKDYYVCSICGFSESY